MSSSFRSYVFLLIIRAQRRTSAFRTQKTQYWRFGQNGINPIFYYYFARKRCTEDYWSSRSDAPATPPDAFVVHFHSSVNFSITILLLLVSHFSHLYISYFHPISSTFGSPSTLWHPDPHRTIKASRPRLNIPMLKVTKCPGIFTPNF